MLFYTKVFGVEWGGNKMHGVMERQGPLCYTAII